jgi:hypothetical protein
MAEILPLFQKKPETKPYSKPVEGGTGFYLE